MRPSDREFAEFNGLLRSVVEKGLPLAPAVQLMAGVVRDGSLRRTLADLAGALQDGAPLHEALARAPDVFPPEYRALIRAGVEGNRLAEVLRTSEVHYTYRARLRSKFTRLCLYLLVGAAIGELALLLTHWAGGHIEKIHQSLGITELPTEAHTWFMVSSGWMLPVVWPLSVALTAAAFFLAERWASVGWIAYFFPLWGQVQKSRDLSGFCSTLGLRLRSGATMVDALRSGRDAVGNSRFRRSVDKLIRRVDEGESLSGAMFYLTFFPKTLSWGLSLAEESGEIPRTLDTFAGLYTSQMERNFDLLYELLTPLGILAVGNATLLAATMLLLPILRVQSSLG